MDSLKDPIFSSTVGMAYQPTARLFSVLTTLLVVCIYDYLTSVISKIYLFHTVCAVFGLSFFVLASYLADPMDGLGNVERSPDRYLGWICYFAIESYGSLMVALFWSFTNTIMDLEQAKGAYGMIISVAQIGAVLGSAVARNATIIGIPKLFVLVSLNIFSISLAMKMYSLMFRDTKTQTRCRSSTETDEIVVSSSRDNLNGVSSYSDVSTQVDDVAASMAVAIAWLTRVRVGFTDALKRFFGGFYDGLMLIIRHPYVTLLLFVATLDEIIVAMLDYQFKLLASVSTSSVPTASGLVHAGGEGDSSRFAQLLGNFGVLTNVTSFIFAFFGFSFLVRKLGVRLTLLIFPMCLFLTVIITNLVPNLWVLFIFLSTMKSMIFSLHDPVKELLFMPTSEAIKFKAGAWINVFGSRFAKACGSFVVTFAHGDVHRLRVLVEMPCIIISIVFMGCVYKAGLDFDYLTTNKIVVGREPCAIPLFSNPSDRTSSQSSRCRSDESELLELEPLQN